MVKELRNPRFHAFTCEGNPADFADLLEQYCTRYGLKVISSGFDGKRWWAVLEQLDTDGY